MQRYAPGISGGVEMESNDKLEQGSRHIYMVLAGDRPKRLGRTTSVITVTRVRCTSERRIFVDRSGSAADRLVAVPGTVYQGVRSWCRSIQSVPGNTVTVSVPSLRQRLRCPDLELLTASWAAANSTEPLFGGHFSTIPHSALLPAFPTEQIVPNKLVSPCPTSARHASPRPTTCIPTLG